MKNNGYAAVTPAASTHGQPDVARRADGYGIPGVIVDRQDYQAVYTATKAAVARARRGEGPTLIEAKTYRFDEHCVGLFINGGYRPAEEVAQYKNKRDPVTLFRNALLADGMSESEVVDIECEAHRLIEEA